MNEAEPARLIVFTDLDGTLLEHYNYTFKAALPALTRLRRLDARVVYLSSKTLQEMLFWRARTGNNDPFSVENGGAVFLPHGSSPSLRQAARTPSAYDIVEFGLAYDYLVASLREASRESACLTRGFSDMTAEEVALCCEIDVGQAKMAKARCYDEPFQLLAGNLNDLQAAIERRGLKLVRGGRFLHIKGKNDKADAVRLLREAYETFLGSIRTVGIGDAPNDVGFLNLVDVPVVLDSPSSADVLRRVHGAQLFPPGPSGWNEAILEIAERYAS